jgi:L-fuconate dehydratase
MRITGIETIDLRFPTSRDLAGSDAMNPDPDYSAAYVILSTDDGPKGMGSRSRSGGAPRSSARRSTR